MPETQFIRGIEEYFCWSCGQLRLNATHISVESCGNCGGTNLTIGKPRELNKEKLKKEWREKNESTNP